MRSLVVSAVLTAACAVTLPAQGLGLALGTLVPQGDLADGAKSGFVGIASLELDLVKQLSLRAEALWANSDLDGAVIKNSGGASVPEDAEVSGDVKLVGGLASFVYSLGEGILRPYVLAGAGYYQRSVSQSAAGAAGDLARLDRDESKVGLHAGIGLRFGILGVTAFGEARYHTVNTDGGKTNFVPILVGLRF